MFISIETRQEEKELEKKAEKQNKRIEKRLRKDKAFRRHCRRTVCSMLKTVEQTGQSMERVFEPEFLEHVIAHAIIDWERD